MLPNNGKVIQWVGQYRSGVLFNSQLTAVVGRNYPRPWVSWRGGGVDLLNREELPQLRHAYRTHRGEKPWHLFPPQMPGRALVVQVEGRVLIGR